MICEVRVEKGHLLYGNSKVSKKQFEIECLAECSTALPKLCSRFASYHV